MTRQRKITNKNFLRNIITTYYGRSGREELWYNRGLDADTCIDRAFSRMRQNTYGAFVAEVWNEDSGELYAVIIHSTTGEIRTIFQKDPATKVVVTNFSRELVDQVVKKNRNNALVEELFLSSELLGR